LPRRLKLVLPALAAVILALPCFSYTYLYDDYDFLPRARSFHLASLAPDPQVIFYRPLSREVWFGLATLAHLDSPFALHILNAMWLALGVFLLTKLADRLLGFRAALIAGFCFAGLGALPVLIWASGVQDLMAIDLVLAAFLLRLAGRPLLAFLAMAGAILSKETAIAILPLFAPLEWVLERKAVRFSSIVLPSLGLLIVWLTVHPGVHALFGRGLASGSGGYLGFDQPDRARAIGNTLLALVNIPVGRISRENLGIRLIALVLACALIFVALRGDGGRNPSDLSVRAPQGRVLAFAGMLTLLPMALTVCLVRHWAPYYADLPAVGTSIAAGALLRDQPFRRVAGFLAAFFTLGILARQALLDPSITTELNLERTSWALERVEEGFKRLHPSFPAGSAVYVSAQIRGVEGVYTHMYRFQAPRVWYRDGSLLTAKPRERRPDQRHEYLFWIVPNLDVAEIDLATLRARSSGARPTYAQYQKTLRGYAFGLAASGETMRAARILLRMPEPNGEMWGVDARLASAFLLAAGKPEFARDVLGHVPALERNDALGALAGALAESPPGLDLDDPALAAFGIDADDSGAARILMRWFLEHRYEEAASRFAQRVLRLVPGDMEAGMIFTDLSRRKSVDQPTPQGTLDLPGRR